MGSEGEPLTFAPLVVFEHPPSGRTLLPILRRFLPHSIPLYRRLQHHSRTPHAHILSTLPPSVSADLSDLPQCFAIAYVDRTARPETEMWAFLPGEISTPSCTCATSYASTLDFLSTLRGTDSPQHAHENLPPHDHPPGAPLPPCAAALLSILQHIRKLPVPSLSAASEEDAMSAVRARQTATDTNTTSTPSPSSNSTRTRSTSFQYLDPALYTASLNQPTKLLLGTSAALSTALLAAHRLVRTDLPGLNFPHRKYIFAKSALRDIANTSRGTLPEGLRWGELRHHDGGGGDYALVRARSSIPRRDATLREYGNVAVFRAGARKDGEGEEKDGPVAWAFLSKDGSLTALHVEKEFRGKGVARAVGARTMCLPLERGVPTGGGVRGEEDGDGDGLVHADVAAGNVASERVCEALGGKDEWRTWWLRLDLDAVGRMFGD